MRNETTQGEPLNVLVLQGGGALGAYQAGAFDALARHGYRLDWIAGISIGAINAALIAGNPPQRRIERLRAFWEQVSMNWLPAAAIGDWLGPVRPWWDDAIASFGALQGVPGFFRPRPPSAWWPRPPASLYDTAPLRTTLEELVDFELLNDGPVRISVGAVDVQSGNFTYFDNRIERIGPEHLMASGALPPGFPAVEVDGRWYWDGGIVSNTPLAHVLENAASADGRALTVFQVDLFAARGKLPETLAEAAERQKDIQYSSRTRAVSDRVRERHQLHARLRALAALLPPAARESVEARGLLSDTEDPPITLVHVIHRRQSYETQSKDYAFSRIAMTGHWQAGAADMDASLALLRRQPPLAEGEFRVLDCRPDPPQTPRLRRAKSAPHDSTNR